MITSSSHSISILGPCGTAKTPKIFQTLKLSAQSSSSVAPEAQKPAIVTGPLTPKTKQMPVRRGDVPLVLVGPMLCHQDPVPVLDRGSRQHHRLVAWWNPLNRLAIRRRLSFGETVHSETRLQERDQQIRQQSQEILDLSWKAKVAADWTEWWEHHSHEFTPLPQQRPSTDRRRSRSRSVSTSVTRRTGRSVTPSQGSRRSVTPTRRGRVGPGPLGGLGEETLQKIEAQHCRAGQPGNYGIRHRL